MTTDTRWVAAPPSEFRDERMVYRRDSDYGKRRVRAFRGWILARRNNVLVREHCGHAHTKPATARRCAEAWAKRRNKQEEVT